MKIYQLHKYGGEYEDAYDYIIGSYLKKERAEEEQVKAKERENKIWEHSNRCKNCPYIENAMGCTNVYPDYCPEPKLEEVECGWTCKNYYIKFDKSSFYIKEVEVEE